MYFIVIVLMVPAVILFVRIFLLLNDKLWNKTKCEILSFDMVEKNYGFLVESQEGLSNNYIEIVYSYDVDGVKYKSKRLGLGLLDRSYTNVEVEHDPLLSKIRNNDCSIYYVKRYPGLSVLNKSRFDVYSNLSLLLTYVSVIISSYLFIEWIG